MADKVTLSLDPDTLSAARAAARGRHEALSTWMERAARRELIRTAGDAYSGWLAEHPDRADVAAWDALATRPDTRAELDAAA